MPRTMLRERFAAWLTVACGGLLLLLALSAQPASPVGTGLTFLLAAGMLGLGLSVEVASRTARARGPPRTP
ncbi:MAG: hypothetical protein LC624_00370 [Halobacteriales archaeon]|nr:hypothetical protein [Halobacteriales archaeon]